MRSFTSVQIFSWIAIVACGGLVHAQNVFTNNSPISIPSSGNAIPYPSTIGVSGLTPPGNISNVVVTLNGVTHPRPSDLDIVLVGPGGQHCELLSDAGNTPAVSGATLTFSRTGRVLTPADLLTAGGTFAPVNFGSTLENFPSPGPGLVSNIDLAVFDGTSAIGTWSLFIIDDNAGPSTTTGSIAGWSIRFNDPIQESTQSGTEFSYQGVLKKDGAPFTGAADLRFSLWNDATSTLPGTQFGGSIERPSVPVQNGIFTTSLDFGPSVFSEKRRFLQVESRVAPETDFTPIFPRTLITGVPFSGTTPLAKAANQLDAPDGSPTKIVEVDNSGFAKVNSSLLVSGNIDVGFDVNVDGKITLAPTSRSRLFPACAWQPVLSSASYATNNGDWITGSTAGSTLTLFMPLNLPDGAIIREITLFCDDSSSTGNVAMSLRRVQNNGSPAVLGAGVLTSGTPGNTSISITGMNETVDANVFAPTLNATWPVPSITNQIRIGNVRVKYDITSPLP
jgi:subtilisin-like proprotein convertase family protein